MDATVRAESLAALESFSPKTLDNGFTKEVVGPDGKGKKLIFRFSDRSYALHQGALYENVSPALLPKGHAFTFVLLENGESVFGRVDNLWEFGVKHAQLADGRKVKLSGELKINANGSYEYNFESGTYTERVLSKMPLPDREAYNRKMELIAAHYFENTIGKNGIYRSNIALVPSRQPTEIEIADLCNDWIFLSQNSHLCIEYLGPIKKAWIELKRNGSARAGEKTGSLGYLFKKIDEVKSFDEITIRSLALKAIIAASAKTRSFILVPLKDLAAIHGISATRESAYSKVLSRSKKLGEYDGEVRSEGGVTVKVQLKAIPSNVPISVVRDRDGKFIVFNGSGRLKAIQLAYAENPDVKVEVEFFDTDSSMVFNQLEKILELRNAKLKNNSTAAP